MGKQPVRFVRDASKLAAGDTLVLWGDAPLPGRLADGVGVVRVEDGFLRSVGLGVDLVQPLSWVIDNRGLYYDASRPSDLECLLQESHFDAAMLARAARLRQRIVDAGLSKYNVGNDRWVRPAGSKRVILVPGQVESDASIRTGAAGIRTNIGLLRAVREANPDAYILYKPHPDVAAGLRAMGAGEDQASTLCDEVAGEVAMSGLLPEVDEVHVMTSLAGFEALLRGKPVTCYGQPFYAGWGLTQDKAPIPRRTRKLDLDVLVAATLIRYPRYVSRTTGKPITPEEAIAELLAWRAQSTAELTLWRRFMRCMLRKIVGVR
ncbi:MAG: beta-3-deoxy-D-manno-oct-2-ulosonic acid transferase [Thiobacillus sp.]|nr:beta-3-deoxy-D-manno-oct-2-ulosonic acid transferase [Thiobacillus sp.]